MNRYLTIHIPETAVPMPVSRFLRTQAGLTKKQISQAKFRPGGIKKNGQQCRVTETAYPGDQILVCLETDDVDSAQLESATFTVNSDRQTQPFVPILLLMPAVYQLQLLIFFLNWKSSTKTRTFLP